MISYRCYTCHRLVDRVYAVDFYDTYYDLCIECLQDCKNFIEDLRKAFQVDVPHSIGEICTSNCFMHYDPDWNNQSQGSSNR